MKNKSCKNSEMSKIDAPKPVENEEKYSANKLKIEPNGELMSLEDYTRLKFD